MIEMNTESEKDSVSPDPTVLFLGLYLLMVAFFILLNSISTFEEEKAKQAIGSVTSAFKDMGVITRSSDVFTSDIGSYAQAAASLVKVGNLVRTAIELAKVVEVKPGETMKVSAPADSFFLAGQAELVSQADKLLDSIGLILSRPPQDLRFDVEIVVGSDWILPKDLESGQTLEIARAGTLARELRARGAPEDSLITGIDYRDPGMIDIFFYVRSIEGEKLDFEEVAQ